MTKHILSIYVTHKWMSLWNINHVMIKADSDFSVSAQIKKLQTQLSQAKECKKIPHCVNSGAFILNVFFPCVWTGSSLVVRLPPAIKIHTCEAKLATLNGPQVWRWMVVCLYVKLQRTGNQPRLTGPPAQIHWEIENVFRPKFEPWFSGVWWMAPLFILFIRC